MEPPSWVVRVEALAMREDRGVRISLGQLRAIVRRLRSHSAVGGTRGTGWWVTLEVSASSEPAAWFEALDLVAAARTAEALIGWELRVDHEESIASPE